MPTTTTTAQVPRPWRGGVRGRWRHSLRFRTLAVTLALTALAVVVTCVTMALTIQANLFDARKDQALTSAQRVVVTVQRNLYSADTTGDRAALQSLMRTVRDEIGRLSSTEFFAVFRIDDEPSSIAPLDFTAGLSEELVTPSLRALVQETPGRQWWQSAQLPAQGEGAGAGIIVGQQFDFPGAGHYELYLAYDLAEAESTLLFVQRTLWIAGTALVALIAGIAWFALRSVVVPITEAAETSARLAAGDLGVRLPVRGDDELAVLGRSFNAMADSIEGQIKELGELSLVQQRFVSDVSHELRTPLTTIRLAAEMINDRREEFDPATARSAELLHAQVQRFDTLLADLLEISRYDAGSVQLEREATSLASIAEDIVEQLRPLADQHGSRLRLVAPGGYTPVDLDARRVRRVLRNLIGNAIEHGEGRPVVVTVDSNRHAVAVGVRDFGLGMSPEDSERVFDRFWRADPSRQRTIGGTGLGLSIALGDARLHGGTLAVWSELGVGSNFVLTLPRGQDVLSGPSPVPLEPQESLADLGGVTQPIVLPSVLGEDAGSGEHAERTQEDRT